MPFPHPAACVLKKKPATRRCRAPGGPTAPANPLYSAVIWTDMALKATIFKVELQVLKRAG